ncbi:hypothetical protein M0812_28787 [Anaeramoeba flamelloides]|uniref:Uncharacterized protein n=1 Tax=Anaeramoeba flamelloides TaxID=1746091 RepID=A0AAV7YFL0_9EUKA|nr:hypothetical protein M0812_28787 [Anaeramoeba flamelloides]
MEHSLKSNELPQYLEGIGQESTKILIADKNFIQSERKLLKYLKKNQKEHPNLIKVFFNAFPINFPKEIHSNDVDENDDNSWSIVYTLQELRILLVQKCLPNVYDPFSEIVYLGFEKQKFKYSTENNILRRITDDFYEILDLHVSGINILLIIAELSIMTNKQMDILSQLKFKVILTNFKKKHNKGKLSKRKIIKLPTILNKKLKKKKKKMKKSLKSQSQPNSIIWIGKQKNESKYLTIIKKKNIKVEKIKNYEETLSKICPNNVHNVLLIFPKGDLNRPSFFLNKIKMRNIKYYEINLKKLNSSKFQEKIFEYFPDLKDCDDDN